MTLASTPELRAEVVRACRVMSHFKIVEGFGHVSCRIPGSDRFLMTPRMALGLVTEQLLCELDKDGRQVAGGGSPPLEVPMHMAVYKARPDVQAISRGHPRNVAAYAVSCQTLKVAHGFGANLGHEISVYPEPFLIKSMELGREVARHLGKMEAVILRANGMLAVGQSVAHATVQALFLEETCEMQLKAQAAGFTPQHLTAEQAERRHGDDRVHEPIRAFEYYAAVAEGRLSLA
ncbi:MAG: L-ribulose-5-phosphate 4-epimerase [Pseudomonadota bacterium]|jgi:ribulose-5-phosphate 4-epimerase/fuculose-1-phosphate aldolase